MSTNVYTAKAALFDRLTVAAGTGQPLAGIQVAYAFPGAVELECVYGGGVRFTHEDATAERNVLLDEAALVAVYIRVHRKEPLVVRETDARAAEIFGELAALLTADPGLAGGLSFAGITQGQGDYDQPDGESITILSAQVRVESTITYGAL